METALQPSTGSIANNGNPRSLFIHSPDASGLNDCRTPRYHDRFGLDAFQSPLDSLSSHRKQSNALSAAAESLDPGTAFDPDVIVSPRTVPESFQSQHATDRWKYGTETPSSLPTASGHLEELHSPVLNIRRTSSSRGGSISNDTSEFHLSDALNEYQLKRHASSTSCGSSQFAFFGAAAVSSPQDTTFLDENSKDGTVPSCDESHCTHHHHRQRSSSIVSIKCDRSDDSMDSDEDASNVDAEPSIDLLAGDIEGSIQLEPMAASMLVPLINRENEMSDLLAHPSNRSWVGLVEHAVGKDIYKTQCLHLWCKSSRKDLSDIEWLRCSKKLLTKSYDNRLWRDFCGMVGWDEEEIPLEVEQSSSGKKISSDSLRSVASANMNAIKEEPEEE